MRVNLRCALVCVGAVSTLAACSGSHSPAPSASSPGRSSHHAGVTPTAPAVSGSAQSSVTGPPPPPKSEPTSVPPPVPGNISQTVAPGTSAPLPPTGLDSTARFRKVALTAAVADPSRVKAQAHIPGEIAGPALAFDLQLTNRGRTGLDLSTNIAVTAHDAAGTPFTALTTSTRPVSGTLRPGAHATGHYVFHLPDNIKNPVTIEVTYAATAEVARFVGPLS